MQHVIDVAKLDILHLSVGVKSCSVVDVGKRPCRMCLQRKTKECKTKIQQSALKIREKEECACNADRLQEVHR